MVFVLVNVKFYLFCSYGKISNIFELRLVRSGYS